MRNYADALTERVSERGLRQYKRDARRAGLIVVMSAPAGSGGFYVTTATRPEGGIR